MTHRNRILSRWLVGIAATVLSGVVLALLIWIGQTAIAQLKAQATTTEQIRGLTVQVAQLRTELASVPALRDEVSRLKAHQDELQRRVGRLEDGHG